MPKAGTAARGGRIRAGKNGASAPLSDAIASGFGMFDGNHRIRRDINLGGGSSRVRRGRAAAGAAGAPSSSRRVARGGVGGGATSVGVGFSAAAAAGGRSAAASGIPDRKSELLESARIQREARREEKRRNDAARTVQRLFRGRRCREGAAGLLGERYRAALLRATASRSNGATKVVGVGAVAAAELASVLSMRLSPPLLPFLGGGHSGTASAEPSERDALLSLGSALDASREDPWKVGACREKDAASMAIAVARANFVRGRLVRRALRQLRCLCPPENAESEDAASSTAAAAAARSARGLERLVAALLGASDLHNSRAAAASALAAAEGAAAPILLPVLRNGPRTSRLEGSGLVSLFLCFRDWFWRASSFDREGDRAGAAKETATALLHLSCRAAASLESSSAAGAGKQAEDALSVLASALFCSRPSVFQGAVSTDGGGSVWGDEFRKCVAYFRPGRADGTNEKGAAGWHATLLSSLARTLLGMQESDSESSASAVREAVVGMVSGREYALLSNVISFLDESAEEDNGSVALASAAVHLLSYVLRRRRGELAVLAALAAKGEDVRRLLLGNGKGGAAEAPAADVVDLTNGGGDDDDDDDESSDSEDEDMDEAPAPSLAPSSAAAVTAPAATAPAAAAPSSGSLARSYRAYKRSQSNRLTRQEVQTVPKLDRLYQSEAAGARRSALAAIREGGHGKECLDALAELATRIGGGALVVRLGSSLFVAGDGPADARSAYAATLSDLLQFCTSSRVRPSAASPLLSRLAFHPRLLGALWRHASAGIAVGSPGSAAATCAFCDAFGHRLMAVDDEEFLGCYAAAGRDGGGGGGGDGGTIEAGNVISGLRTVLYELYWTRPVVAADVAVPSSCAAPGDDDRSLRCHRARLLLSGTKLWNALYERWCRLYRTAPFCEEERWWFPRLVTRERDEGGAVVPGTSAASSGRGSGRDDDGEDEDMDDGDSAASPMDVDDGESDGAADGRGEGAAAAADEESDALASSFRDPKMARVLTSIPQSLPFERRVRLFHSLLDADKARTQDEERSFRAMMMRMQRSMDSDEEWEFTGREKVEIRRDRLYEDSMEQLNGLGRKLRRKVQVTFINQHGALEAGIDGGGVFKEFLDDLIKDAFDPQVGRRSHAGSADGNADGRMTAPLFSESPVQTLQVNPDAGTSRPTLAHYEFLGRVLGKAVYESILVEPQFCLPFLNQLLGKQNTIDDLKNLDPEYYRHLNALRKMSEKEIEGLGLTFEYTAGGAKGSGRAPWTVELVPGGSSVPVTKSNVIRYVHLVAHRKLNAETAIQTHVFLRGFRDLIPAAWVRLFSSYELQKLIGGDDSVRGIDVNGLRSVMQYAGGYHPSQPIIRWFWQVLEEMTAQQQRNFLKFMTSCSRQPLLGFHALVPLPCIQQIRLREDGGARRGGGDAGGGSGGGGDVRLPTSSTCMNLLKLPNYASKEVLREKLLYAIEAGAGFELS